MLHSGPGWGNADQTPAEFRGNYQYNLLDSNLRRCYAEVPVLASGTTTRRGIPERFLIESPRRYPKEQHAGVKRR
jgi:hypothetical protein